MNLLINVSDVTYKKGGCVMSKKWVLIISIISLMVIIIIVAISFKNSQDSRKDKINEVANNLQEKMEEKYDITITKKEGYYSKDMGYGVTLTTDNGITFDAWERKNDVIDFYMEEVWRTQVLNKWGYAHKYIDNIKKIDVNVGFRDGVNKDINLLFKEIVDVKNDLWLTIYIDLDVPYDKNKARNIEEGVLNYYFQLQKDEGDGIELIIRHKENSKKQDTGSYLIIRDEDGKLPTINNVEDIADTFFN